jgi:hypothetical protein
MSDSPYYVLTSRGVSTLADATQAYVTQLANEGLLPHVTASDGTRLYPEEAAAIVRRIKAERLARRGRRRVA